MPKGYLKLFISKHVTWTGKQQSIVARRQNRSKWYMKWRSELGTVAAVADDAPARRTGQLVVTNMPKRKAPRPIWLRKRAPGGGRRHKAQHVRAELFEWPTSIRRAID